MIRATASAPARIDLAGGTLDIWPLYLLLPEPVTVNLAIDRRARAQVTPRSDGRVCLRSMDTGEVVLAADARSAANADGLPLLRAIVGHLAPAGGFTLATRSGVPPGSGLGGSSALAIAALHALGLSRGSPLSRADLLLVARDIEAAVLRIPTGLQDHIAAVHGGLSCVRLGPGAPERTLLASDPSFLTRRLVLALVGASRLSGDTNWRMLRGALDGNARALAGFCQVADAARAMRDALLSRDMDAAAAALKTEYSARRTLARGVETPEMIKAHRAALSAGALAGKVCGAGGGGGMIFLTPPGGKARVTRALAAAGARVLRLGADGEGLLP